MNWGAQRNGVKLFCSSIKNEDVVFWPQKINVLKQIVSNSKDKIRGFVEEQLEKVNLDDKTTPEQVRNISIV